MAGVGEVAGMAQCPFQVAGRVAEPDQVYAGVKTTFWDDRSDTATLRDDRNRTVDAESLGPPPLTRLSACRL
ncbi:hypothetical protein ACQEVM_37230 [Streptomyces sp. CA-243310]|uniref:hypothetical protein n=1 Tax=Streptomyces sp. CA-243310 TaxID=3240056 RepID=UPI003D94C0EB